MKKKTYKKAFSLAEIIVVLVIISLLATVVGTATMKYVERARVETTKTNLRTLHSAVNNFFTDTGRFPEEEEGLIVLIEPPADAEGYDPEGYLEQTEIPKDGWKHEFQYERYPEVGGIEKPFLIRSAGPDGEMGTEDDLVSTSVG